MDLKRHGFWVAMGAGFAVALIAYVALVPFGVSAAIGKKGGKLRDAVRRLETYAKVQHPGDPKDGLPVKESVEYWESQRNALEAELGKMRKYLRTKDKNFESIIGGDSNRDDISRFTVSLKSEMDRRGKRYKPILPEDKSFKDIADVFGGKPIAPGEEHQIPVVMKRFLLASAIAQAAAAAGATQLISIEFKEAPQALKPEARHEVGVQLFGATAVLDIPAQGSLGGADKQKNLQRDAKDELKLYADSPAGISTLVAAFLQNPKLILQVASLKVTKTGFTNPQFEPWGLFVEADGGGFGAPAQRGGLTFKQDVYIGTHNTEEVKEGIPDLVEPSVRITIEVNVLDFHIPDEGGRN